MSEEEGDKGTAVPATTLAIRKIKSMITDGELAPGDRLPAEAELADRLGVSRGSLREAVRVLDEFGVLDVRQGDGTYVSDLDPGLLGGAMSFVTELLEEESILELYEVRRILEPEAYAMAAAAIDDDGLDRMELCLRRMERAKTAEEFAEAEIEFHAIPLEYCSNSVLVEVTKGVTSRTLAGRLWYSILDKTELERSARIHRAIYDALVARNPSLIRAATVRDLMEGEFWLRQHLSVTKSGEGRTVTHASKQGEDEVH
mgnify:CR=1 FL=1